MQTYNICKYIVYLHLFKYIYHSYFVFVSMDPPIILAHTKMYMVNYLLKLWISCIISLLFGSYMLLCEIVNKIAKHPLNERMSPG